MRRVPGSAIFLLRRTSFWPRSRHWTGSIVEQLAPGWYPAARKGAGPRAGRRGIDREGIASAGADGPQSPWSNAPARCRYRDFGSPLSLGRWNTVGNSAERRHGRRPAVLSETLALHCVGIAPLGENRTGGGTSTSGLNPLSFVSVAASGMAPSLNAAPAGEDEVGSAGVAVTADTVGMQKLIVFDVPNADATGAVPPSGVMVELDEDPVTGVVGTGDVVTGNVANGDVIDGEAGDGDAIEDDVMDAMAGKVAPAAPMPFTGHVVMLPIAGVCDWPRLPV
jgi:hypothetical protein